MVLPRRLEPEKRCVDQHPAGGHRRYGASDRCRGIRVQGAGCAYESTRAQFEAFAANGWNNHKMTIYWMLNNHWPSFFGHLFDYYLRPGGAYYGAKKGLRPLSVVFDSYATGDHDQAKITVVNQTPTPAGSAGTRTRLRPARQGARRPTPTRSTSRPAERASDDAAPNRLGLKGFLRPLPAVRQGRQSHRRKRVLAVAPTRRRRRSAQRSAFELKQASWADMTALNYMTRVPLEVTARRVSGLDEDRIAIRLHNPRNRSGSSSGRRSCRRVTVMRFCRSSTATTTSPCSRVRQSNPGCGPDPGCGCQLGESHGVQHAARGGADRLDRTLGYVTRIRGRVP